MIALVLVIAFVVVGSYIILKITDLISPLSTTAEDKAVGQDLSQHDEALPTYDVKPV
jgi:Amt family ammonium transporter